MNFVKHNSKKDCWKSGNVLLKVRINVEEGFIIGKFSSENFFWTRTTQIGENCRNVYVRRVKFFCPKCKKMTKLKFFSKRNFCPRTKFWTGKIMLLPFLPKKLRSKSDMFKIHKKWIKTYWKDFATVLRQLWENWHNIFVWSAKTSSEKLWKNYCSLFFKQFLTPTFCSRKDKRNLWYATQKKNAESLEKFCSKSE